jgi:hypothetical protein
MKTVIRTALFAAALLVVSSAWADDKPNAKPDDKAKPATDEKLKAPTPIDDKAKPAADVAPKNDEPGVHRMEIYNGPLRSVHYIYRGLSSSEAQAVRDLERAENETTLANEMLALRMQYVSGERALDAQRRFSQQQLYGYSAAESESGSFSFPRREGLFGYIRGGWGGWGGGWGGYGGGWGGGYSAGYSSADSVGLAVGVGDEGRIKTAMAPVVASQATPEYAAKVGQDLTAAATRAASYATVRNTLGLKPSSIVPVGGDVTITRVLDGKAEKIQGKVLSEEGDWLILDTPAGKRSVLKSTIVDVLEPRP